MSNEEFLLVLEEVKGKIATIGRRCRGEKQLTAVFKIEDEIDSFQFQIGQGYVEIYYDNKNIPIVKRYTAKEQGIVFPLMLLYTNVAYYVLQAKSHLTKRIYELICAEKQKLGEAIRKICMQDFEECVITKEKVEKLKAYVNWVIPQLHHCSGEMDEYSERFDLQDSRKLKKVRGVYRSFMVDTKHIYYHDEIMGEDMKILVNSPMTAYVVSMLFCESYITSITWLKKYEPTRQWCLLVPWNIITTFQELITKLYY